MENQPAIQPSAEQASNEASSGSGEPEEFIDTVRRHPELWDKRNDWYANRQKKVAGWEDVASHHIKNWKTLSPARKAEKMKLVKKRWKALRDNFKRELLKQQQTKSGSGSKKGRIYCHYLELEFLKPVMEERQTENNFTSDSEDEVISQTHGSTSQENHQFEEDVDLDDRETPLPPRKNTMRSKNNKKRDTQDFIDVVKNLIETNKAENNEITSFTKSLAPHITEVRKDLQCDLMIDILKIIKDYQIKSNCAPAVHSHPMPNQSQPFRPSNQWEGSGFRPIANPQFNNRYSAPYDMPHTYHMEHHNTPPLPPPPPPTTPQAGSSREDINSRPYYHDLG
ncbi:uncharacterized protein LOC120933394 [Rana temporaria]|uniref:uncharacterized protein LOC120929643 n=2 Tax=Rana temporaria TaxID=8407 RepID=UPI001AAD9F06|nr:uncharacterized protein LOC120929643 [Rana temporaria]XP_040202534.1 uncharacterized protein LOC120933394 [Rana temporaria]